MEFYYVSTLLDHKIMLIYIKNIVTQPVLLLLLKCTMIWLVVILEDLNVFKLFLLIKYLLPKLVVNLLNNSTILVLNFLYLIVFFVLPAEDSKRLSLLVDQILTLDKFF